MRRMPNVTLSEAKDLARMDARRGKGETGMSSPLLCGSGFSLTGRLKGASDQ